MSMLSSFQNKALYGFVAGVVFVSCFFKIADLDFWWHLKTGRIIFEQKAFQHEEIYSFTAPGREYIDHEWLFQVIQYFFFNAFGATGVILLKSVVIISIYLFSTRFLLKRNASAILTMGIVLLSVCGARPRFIERPEVFTTLFLVISYVLIEDYLTTGKKLRLALILPIIVVWSNIHAAVILGLLLQLTFIGGLLLESFLKKFRYPATYDAEKSRVAILGILLVLSLLLTGLNPYGYRMLKVPFELTSIIDSGLLNNQEWQQPTPKQLPFFFLCFLFSVVLMVFHFRSLHLVNFFLAAFFGYISLKYVRNIGLFSMLMPLFVAPYAASLSKKRTALKTATLAMGICFLIVLSSASVFEFGIGEASYFPDRIVQFTKEKNLQGNLINSYGFGGYLIWHLYPERRIFIDGRNEVYLQLLERLKEVRADSRLWKQFLADYQIEYALLNYIDDLEKVTIITNNQAVVTYAPFSSTHFPRSMWALIYWDDDGMILVRRAGLNKNLVSMEYTSVFPEGRFYQESLARVGKIDRKKALEELQRKLAEDPSSRRARHLFLAVKQAGS